MATGYTPQQIASIAKAQVAAALNPQVSAIRQQGSLTDQQLTQQAQNAQNAYNAVAELMKNLSGQVQAPYTQAAQTQGALGKGFSNLFTQNTQANADQANALLAQNNSPAHVNAPTGQANVIYALGGYDPASVLNTQGAALASAAANRPANTRLQGVQAYQAGLGKVAQNDLQTNQDVAKLLATAPALQQTAVDKINSAVLAGQKLDLQTSNDLFNQWAKTQSLKQGSQRLSLSKAKQQFDQWATSQGLNIRWANLAVSQQKAALAAARAAQPGKVSAALSAQVGYAVDGAGNPILKNGNTIPWKGSAGKSQFTPKQVSDFKKVAAATAADLWEGVPQTDKKTGKFTGWVQQPLTYQQALQYMTDRGIPMYIAQLSLKRYWTRPGYEADVNARTAATQAGKPIVPTWVKSDTGPVYARGQGAKAFAAGKGGAAAKTAANTPTDWRIALSPQGAGGVWTAPWNMNLNPAQQAQIAQQALAIGLGTPYVTPANVQALVGRMNQESGGSTAKVNKWDSNWQAGTPSIGLLQTIPGTFAKYALPGHTNIWDPLDNAIAAIRYMLARYGRIVGPGPGGY